MCGRAVCRRLRRSWQPRGWGAGHAGAGPGVGAPRLRHCMHQCKVAGSCHCRAPTWAGGWCNRARSWCKRASMGASRAYTCLPPILSFL
jgi:hypothetical protein